MGKLDLIGIVMRHFETIWIIVSPASFVGWFMNAKEVTGAIMAFIMSVLGILYLYYKTRQMRAVAILKEKELKDVQEKELKEEEEENNG